jgi:hypothetical protein
MAAARACWLCRSSVRASAVAMLASELSDIVIIPERCCGKLRSCQAIHSVSSHRTDEAPLETGVR